MRLKEGIRSVDLRVDAAAKKLGVTFPLLSDESRATIRTFGVEDAENGISWPAIFILDREGKIVWRSLAQTYKRRATAAAILDALRK